MGPDGMNRPMIVATSLVALTLIGGVSHAGPEAYTGNVRYLEILFGDGKRTTKLYAGKRQPDAGLAQILVLSGISITTVDGRRVKSKKGWLGYKAYKQMPGTYEFEVTSWKRRGPNWVDIMGPKLDKHAAYPLQVVLEAGQKYVLSPIWNDGEMGIISPSQVCLQGQSDNARYCASRPGESDDVFAMDEKHGVIVVGLARPAFSTIIVKNLYCEGPAGLRKGGIDVCTLMFETADSKGYIVESVDAAVWTWWGFVGPLELIETVTFDVEPGKVNYVGHISVTRKDGKLIGFRVADHFSSLESTIRAGFGDSEIVNKATHYAGFGDAETEKKATDY